jgi:predicted metal-dependent hydrolase
MNKFLPTYTHIVNPKLKHTYLSFDEAGNLIKKSPKVSQRYVEQLLIKKSAWIRRSKEKIAQKKGKMTALAEEGKLYYKGTAYPLRLFFHDKARSLLHFEEGIFLFYSCQYDSTHLQKQVEHFYRKEAEKFLPEIVERYAQRMQLFPKTIHFRKAKRQWGSCSGKNVLSFNIMLMKLPKDVIEYVIVHELAHIKHKHHQKSFWELVEKYIPLYQEKIKELHTYTT